jgi:hypothetical protein
MKNTVSRSDFERAFVFANRDANFSNEGLMALFNFFVDYENGTGEEVELDVIALCCEYSEDTVEEIAENYSVDLSNLDPENDDYKKQCTKAVRDYLQDNTQLVGETATGFVYLSF